MTIIKCDGCGRVCGTDELGVHSLSIPCHIVKVDGRDYVDREGNAVSGNTVSHDLCSRCFNSVVSVAYLQLQSIRKSR